MRAIKDPRHLLYGMAQDIKSLVVPKRTPENTRGYKSKYDCKPKGPVVHEELDERENAC